MSSKKIQFSLPTKLVDELQLLSKEKQLTKSVLVALALEEYLKNQRKEKNRA